MGALTDALKKFRTIRVTAYIYLVPGVPYPSYHIGGMVEEDTEKYERKQRNRL